MANFFIVCTVLCGEYNTVIISLLNFYLLTGYYTELIALYMIEFW